MTASASILIADDEPTFRESMAELLRQDGYECAVAGSADEALEDLRGRRYDVLIADLRMPGNDDMRLAREAARLAPGTPIIVVTAYPSLDTAVSSIELPVTAYLRKPLEYEQLRAHVESAMERALVQRIIDQSQQQLRDLCWRLESMTPPCGQAGNRSVQQPLQVFVATTLQYVSRAVGDLSRVADAAFRDAGLPNEEALLAVSKLTAAHGLLQHTVEVLEQTKGAFKSKQLAQLRRKVQVFLDEWGPDSAGPQENSAP